MGDLGRLDGSDGQREPRVALEKTQLGGLGEHLPVGVPPLFTTQVGKGAEVCLRCLAEREGWEKRRRPPLPQFPGRKKEERDAPPPPVSPARLFLLSPAKLGAPCIISPDDLSNKSVHATYCLTTTPIILLPPVDGVRTFSSTHPRWHVLGEDLLHSLEPKSPAHSEGFRGKSAEPPSQVLRLMWSRQPCRPRRKETPQPATCFSGFQWSEKKVGSQH